MSLIVLNSKGQDPAEFENHGFQVKLDKESEICLCGVNLNRATRTPLQLTVRGGSNNGWVVANGSNLQSTAAAGASYLPHTPAKYSLKEGVYQVDSLAEEMTLAMRVGNYHSQEYKLDQPISPWQMYDGGAGAGTGGLECTTTGAVGSRQMNFKVAVGSLTNGEYTRAIDIIGVNGGGQTGDSATGANYPTGAGFAVGGIDLVKQNGTDAQYCDIIPSEACLNFIDTRPLWNTENGGDIDARIGEPGGWSDAGAIASDGTNDGYWWCAKNIPEGAALKYADTVVGGLICSKHINGDRVGNNVNPQYESKFGKTNNNSGAYLTPNQAQGAINWNGGETRFDIYWIISRNSTEAGMIIEFFYQDLETIKTNPRPCNNPGRDTKWGQLTIPSAPGGGAANPPWFEIGMRPLRNSAGDAYIIQGVARYRDQPGGIQIGNVALSTDGGMPGFCTITSGKNLDLYRDLPLFQGIAWDNKPVAQAIWEGQGGMSLRSIHHDAVLTSVNGAPPLASIVQPAVAAQANNMLEVCAVFDRIPENWLRNPTGGGAYTVHGYRHDIAKNAEQYANISSAIGGIQGKVYVMKAATTSTDGFVLDNVERYWESAETVAVITLPNIPINGELGAGSTVWGGSNRARVLGVVGMCSDEEYAFGLGRDVYKEPSMENWVEIGNMAQESLNQIKVKICDETGRKLIGLFPDSTIWLKVRNSKGKRLRT